MGPVGEKLIYRKRKKGNDVKKYTRTVNPDLPGQKIQKGYFKEAILEWQQDGYSRIDIQAWNVYARTKKVTASGFNMFTRLKIAAEKEGKIWTKLINCNIYDVTGGGFKVDIDVVSDKTGILYIGTSKYSMLKEFEGTFLENKYTFTVTGLSEKTKYYFYIKNMSAGEVGRTGIYCKKTGVGILVDIDIGIEAKARDGALANYTLINRGNPANASGKINYVEIFPRDTIEILSIGIFYLVGENRLSTRDYFVFEGSIPAGEKTILEVDLNVVEGDYIGIWTNDKNEVSTSGEEGMWFKTGINIPCEDVEFGLFDEYGVSCYGTGKGF